MLYKFCGERTKKGICSLLPGWNAKLEIWKSKREGENRPKEEN